MDSLLSHSTEEHPSTPTTALTVKNCNPQGINANNSNPNCKLNCKKGKICLHKWFHVTEPIQHDIGSPNITKTFRNENISHKKPTKPSKINDSFIYNATQINLNKHKEAWDTLVENILHEPNPIVLTTEPYLKPDHTLPNINNNLIGYFDTKCSDMPRAAIVMHKNLYDQCTLIPEHTNRDQVLMKLNHGTGKILLLTTYMDINHATPDEGYQLAMEYSKKYDLPIISCTDSNSHHYYWGSPPNKTDKRGETLLEYFDKNNLILNNVGNKPTFVNNMGHKTHIDLTVSNEKAYDMVQEWHVSDDLTSSDHRYIKFKINTSTPKPPKEQKRVCSNTDWELFSSSLNKANLTTINPTDTNSLDQAVETLNETLKQAFEKSCPITYISNTIKKPPWLTPEVEKAKAEVRHILKLRKPISNRDKNKPEWLKQREKIVQYHKLRNSIKASKWKKLCEEVESTQEKSRINRILKTATNKKDKLETVQKPNGDYTTNPDETMEVMVNSHFNPSPPNQQNDIEVTTNPETADENLLNKIYSSERLEKIVKEFKPSKAAGPDGFQPILIQNAWGTIKTAAQKIFKCSHRLQYIPKSWQEATGIFIAKPGKADYTNPKSYRTITLTQTLLKIQEKAILWHMVNDLGRQEALNKKQHGFRKGSSTVSALHKVIRTIEKRINKKGFVLGTFLDIEGAFDNVSFDSITKAIHKSKVDESTANWISSMVKNRYITITHKNCTKRFRVSKGCPQGGILSPFLWNLIIDDLLKFPPNEIPADLSAFADDLTLIAEGNDLEVIYQRTQKSINTIEKWCHEKGLNISALKTKIVMFTYKRKWTPPRIITVGGIQINPEESAKLLGVTLDSKLTFNQHIDNITQKATMALMQCRRAIRPSWGLSPQVCKWIYTVVIRPILTYACPVWINALNTQRNTNKLEKVHRLALNTISGAFPNTPTISLNKLTEMPHITNFIRGEAAKGSIRLQAQGSWTVETPPTKSTTLNHHSSVNKEFLDQVTLPTGYNPKNVDLTTPTSIIDKLYKLSIHNREEIVELIDNFHPEKITTYTDGSKNDDGVGFGYIITTNKNKSTIKTESGKLPSYCDVYQSELTAITTASNYLHNTRNKNIILLTDSSSSIKALQKTFTTSKTVMKCHRSLNILAKYNNVETTWVPGHTGIWGNEQADALAKAGTQCNNQTPGLIPYTAIKRAIDKHVKEIDEEKWYKIGTKHTKITLNNKQNHITTLNNKLSNKRNHYSTAIRLMTGVIGLNYHLNKIKITNTDNCPKCGHSPETVNHYLGQCPSYNTIRGETLGTFYSNITEIFETNNLHNIVNYANKTKRLCYDPSKQQQGVT